jgi:hypothetical protein
MAAGARIKPDEEVIDRMTLPQLDETSRKRPIGYCPTCNQFVYYDQVVSGQTQIIPLDTLSEDDLKKLVIERYRVLGQETRIGPMASLYSPEAIVRMIEEGEPFGLMTVQAETNYLRSFLDDLAHDLEQKRKQEEKDPE